MAHPDVTVGSTRPQVSTATLALRAADRLRRFPVATVVGIAVAGLLGWCLSKVAGGSDVGWMLPLAIGMVISVAATLGMISLMTMDDEDLPDLGPLVREVAIVSLGFGVLASVPLIAVGVLLPVGVWETYLVGWLPDQVPYLFATIGPVLLFGMVPAMLVAWPIRSRFDTELMPSIGYVWQKLENTRYLGLEVTLLIAVSGVLLCFVPYLVLIVPVLIAHLAAATFEVLRDDIVVHDE